MNQQKKQEQTHCHYYNVFHPRDDFFCNKHGRTIRNNLGTQI